MKNIYIAVIFYLKSTIVLINFSALLKIDIQHILANDTGYWFKSLLILRAATVAVFYRFIFADRYVAETVT